MTKTISVTLTDPATGTWTTRIPGSVDLATGASTKAKAKMVAAGVSIPENQDMWKVADALLPAVRCMFGAEGDAVVIARVPGMVDPFSHQAAEPGSDEEIACQFRILDGNIEAMI